MDKEFDKYSPYFDQENPECEFIGMIASEDQSPRYELEAKAVFECVNGKYLVVEVSGCSCWPDRGSTTQTVCHSIAEVEQAIKDEYKSWAGLIEQCQNKGWKS